MPFGLRSAAVLVLPLALGSVGQAQEPPTAPVVRKVLGEVTAHDPATPLFSVRKDGGERADVVIDGATACLKVPPGAKALSEAVPAACAAVGVGDRVFARGTTTTEAGALLARQLVVMTKDALAEKRAAESEDWRKRGVGGVVKALDLEKKELTLEIRSFAGPRDLVVAPAGEQASLRRYSPGSARFADSRPCSLTDIRIGDQVRALGEKTPDGSRLLAEQIVAGAFRTLVGRVDGVRPEERELTLADVVSARENGSGTAKRRTLVFDPGARLRRLPTEVAARLAAREARGGGDGVRAGSGGGPWAGRREAGSGGREGGPVGRGEAETGGQGPRRGLGGPPSLAEMLDRFPEVALRDLTPGELVAVAVAEGVGGSASARVEATTLLAGVEPLFVSPAGRGNGGLQTGLAAGALDLGMGMGMGGGGE